MVIALRLFCFNPLPDRLSFDYAALKLLSELKNSDHSLNGIQYC